VVEGVTPAKKSGFARPPLNTTLGNKTLGNNKIMKNKSSRGKIIIINGPSSAGKTTLALALQNQIDFPFLRFSFDLFLDNNALPTHQINKGTFSWNAMRPSVFNGIHQCIPALASAGNNLIVDHIIESNKIVAR